MYIIGFWTDKEMVQPLAWSKTKLSSSELRRAVKKFRNDTDFNEECQMDWSRFYETKRDAMRDLPRYS